MPQTAMQDETERVKDVLYPAPAFSRRQFARSLGWLLLIPATVYLFTFPLVMIPRLGFSHLGVSKFGPVLDYGFEARHVDADVVIFGDSSAFIGIDPRIVQGALGLKTVVIPNTAGSLPVIGVMPLERYLAHNRPPRLLVLYFSAWNLDYNDPRRQDLLFEGEEMLFRHGSWPEIASFARRKPLEVLTFPLEVYSTLGWNNLKYALHHRNGEQEAYALLGHMDYTFPFPPMPTPCKLMANGVGSSGDASVRALMSTYRDRGMRVAVYLAPIPGCTDTEVVLQHRFRSLDATPPVVLPPSWFVGDNSDAHIRPGQVPANSRLFAAGLRRWLQAFGIASAS